MIMGAGGPGGYLAACLAGVGADVSAALSARLVALVTRKEVAKSADRPDL
jgi:ketopantoate reductase